MIRLHHLAIAAGLAIALIPSLCFARPMTVDESRCFELSETVYQAATPREWASLEPCPEAELLSEWTMVECLASCGIDDPGLYDWNNYTCSL